jgi:aminoglycoside/choline kinase family phosphotransferase
MPDRQGAIQAFLDRAGWAGAIRVPLAGDASLRRYERLARGSERAVLMDAPPDRGEDVGPFLAVAERLAGWGFSAPTVLAADAGAGLLLLEDLGDDLFARYLASRPGAEGELYEAAVDLLAALHRHVPPDAPRYGPAEMARAATLAYEWYLPATGRGADAGGFTRLMQDTLAREAGSTDALVLRDYHAENLIWLPERQGVGRVGLLDFQDAAAGHPAYDLASFLTDIRREVSPALRARMEARYAAATGRDPARLRAEVALLAVQRNLRILGTFARLMRRDGKPRYLGFLPRVWDLLERDLAHPVARDIARRIRADLPPPDPDVIARLAACPAIPAQ